MAISYDNINTLTYASAADWASQSADEKAFNFTAATLVDVGTSLWNSVTPDSFNVDTASVLQDIGAVGAVAAYEMNKDTVQTLSFVGGLFIPGLGATKIAQGIRAAMKGTSWLSDARKLEDMAKFNKLIEGGLEGTPQYKAVRNSIYLRGQAANLMDVAAAEVAIAGTLNAHPFMETYWEDPLANFGVSMLLGGGIGAGISALVTRSNLRGVVGGIESAAVGKVAEAAQYQAPILSDAASAIRSLDIAAKNLDNLAKQTTINELTKRHATDWATSMRATQGKLFELMAGPGLRSVGQADKGALDNVRELLKHQKFFGVDSADFFVPTKEAFHIGPRAFGTQESATWTRKLRFGKNAGAERFNGTQYYSQELGGFLTKGSANMAATAADAFTLAGINQAATKLTFKRVHNSYDPLASTPDIEAGFLANLRFFDGLDSARLATETSIVAGDLPAMHGWASAILKRTADVQRRMASGQATSTDLQEFTALSKAKLTVSQGNGKTITLPADQVRTAYLHETGMRINKAVSEGMPREVAALRFNTTPEMVDLVRAKPDGLVGLLLAHDAEKALPMIVRFNSADQIPLALSPTRRILKLGADKTKMLGTTGELLRRQHQAILKSEVLSAETKAAIEAGDSLASQRIAAKVAVLDEEYSTISRLWLETTVLTGKSAMLTNMMRHVVDSAEIKVLREGLQHMVNGRGGNPLYQSADFVTSMMGKVGPLITGIGDQRTHWANVEYQRLATPISSAFDRLLRDPAARTQFAMFDNFRQSTKGQLYYDRGLRTFVIKDGDEVVEAGGPKATLDVVHDAMVALDDASSAILDSQRVLNRLKGKNPPSDIGTWIPSVNLSQKHRGFVINRDTGTVKMLVANTADDLKGLMDEYQPAANETVMAASDVGKSKIAEMSDELMANVVKAADVTKLKKGIGLVAPDISSDRLAEIIVALRDRVNYQATSFVETSLQDVMQKLDYMSDVNQKYSALQGKRGFLQATKELQVKDTAADVKDILLGKNPVHRSQFMGSMNQATSALVQVGINAFSKSWELVKPSFTTAGKGDYDGFLAALKAQGIEDPFAAFHEAARPLLLQRAKNSGYSVNPDRLINSGNALAATLALRFAELAQPMVNMMSLPILSISTISRSVKMHNMNNAGDLLKASPTAVMMNGIRRAHSDLPENKAFLKLFKEEGLLEPIVSEVDEVIRLSRMGTGGLVGGVERAIDSTFVKAMSKPADLSEGLVRKYALMTGVELGRRLYGPKATQRQIAMFARDFMKQSVGNYSTAQRPMMFQGTLGSAMGLFQTYMLTYAQSMYRHIELKDYKGLGKVMLAQGGIFGAGSLPGFQPISQAIGEHFSDEHWDLVSGTYRALPDPMADVLIYGLPSNIAPDVHTRGDINPRVPGGVTTLVAPSMVIQTLETMFNAGKALGQMDANSGQAFMEALAMQSVSRPIARASELITGTAVTRQGSQVAGSQETGSIPGLIKYLSGEEETWSAQGMIARVLSTRTLKESKAREATFLDSYYGAIDNENRQAIVQKLKTTIRAGNLDEDAMDNLAYEYLRTGTPQGFRQAVNQAFMDNDNPGIMDLSVRLRGSPLMGIIEDID